MKREFLSAIFLLTAAGIFAAHRTPADVERIAQKHFAKQQGTSQAAKAHPRLVAKAGSLLMNRVPLSKDSEPFYIYSNGESNFVIVSGDDSMPEVLAYSDNEAFPAENIPSNLEWILAGYASVANNSATISHSGEQARVLTRTSGSPAAEYKESVEPLLGEIEWDQSSPYNDLCPDHTVTGWAHRSITTQF